MKEEQKHRIAGAVGGLLVGGFLGGLLIALVLSSTSRPINTQNIIPLSFASAIVCSVAGYSVKSIGKAFLKIIDIT